MANGTGNGDLVLTALKMFGEMRIEFKRNAIEHALFKARMAREEKRAKKMDEELTKNMRDLALLIQTVAHEVQGLKRRVTRLERDAG